MFVKKVAFVVTISTNINFTTDKFILNMIQEGVLDTTKELNSSIITGYSESNTEIPTMSLNPYNMD